MKNRLLIISSFLLALNCCGGGKADNNNGDNPVAVTSIQGAVTDISGARVEGVTVSLGADSTTTDSEGSYDLAVDAGEDQVITFSRTGYVSSMKRFSIYSGVSSYIPTILMEEAAPQTLDATSGGTVTGLRNASLTVPVGALVDSSGNLISGEVEVYLTPFDPFDAVESEAYPGDLAGIALDGETVPLKTYGVIDLTIRQNGEDLQIRTGESVRAKIPASSMDNNPETIRMWTLEDSGFWSENTNEGIYDETTNTYETILEHLSPVNADRPMDPSCIYGMVVDDQGNPVSGAIVSAQATDPEFSESRGIYSRTLTDLNGTYCMTVERETEVRLTVEAADGTVTTRDIVAGSTASKNYPADCSQSSCKQIQSITTGTTSTDTECSVTITENPFSGTCADDLGDFFACFRPEGACTSDINWNEGRFEFSFENGSTMVLGGLSDLTALGGISYYGPTGQLCGTMTISADGETVFETASGDSVTITVTETGSTQIKCSNGSTILLNAAQQDALINCNGGTTSNSTGVSCTPAAGSFGASCTSDFDCDSSAGNSCCGRQSDDKICLPSIMCIFYDTLSCRDSSDCLDTDSACCSAGFFDICTSVSSCS